MPPKQWILSWVVFFMIIGAAWLYPDLTLLERVLATIIAAFIPLIF
ncbi:hypothetical protein HYS54_02625 [Candidatus Micrarchaeota archaeon]|nr:hypothetical protein [Candidatus Micrarchaeota archaeon]